MVMLLMVVIISLWWWFKYNNSSNNNNNDDDVEADHTPSNHDDNEIMLAYSFTYNIGCYYHIFDDDDDDDDDANGDYNPSLVINIGFVN